MADRNLELALGARHAEFEFVAVASQRENAVFVGHDRSAVLAHSASKWLALFRAAPLTEEATVTSLGDPESPVGEQSVVGKDEVARFAGMIRLIRCTGAGSDRPAVDRGPLADEVCGVDPRCVAAAGCGPEYGESDHGRQAGTTAATMRG